MTLPQQQSWLEWGSSLAAYAQEQLSSVLDDQVVRPDADDGTKQDGVLAEERRAAWGTADFRRYIGADVMSLLSLPMWIMEPLTVLQKMAEILEYRALLAQADAANTPWDRCALVAAFLVSPYGAVERAWKPFNPVLGETFELTLEEGGLFLAEQVSEQPPVAAAHAEAGEWEYDLVSAPTTRFLGNTLEVYPHGRTRILLKRTGEVYTHVPPPATAHNIVVGRTWVDAAGEFYVHCPTTGATCRLKFTPCGWFGAGRYEFCGQVTDAEGVPRLALSGRWNSHCEAVACDAEGAPAEGAEPRRLWTCSPKPEDHYHGFTHFAAGLNSLGWRAGAGLRAPPAASDSRRRPDVAALAAGDTSGAMAAGHRVAEAQRAADKATGEGARRPRWFRQPVAGAFELLPGEADTDVVPAWEWTGAWRSRQVGTDGVELAPGAILGKGFSLLGNAAE